MLGQFLLIFLALISFDLMPNFLTRTLDLAYSVFKNQKIIISNVKSKEKVSKDEIGRSLDLASSIYKLEVMNSDLQKEWSKINKEDFEYQQIYRRILEIREFFTSMGVSPRSTSVYPNQVFRLLKEIGTPTSYKILLELVESGEIPKSYLNQL